MSEIDPEDRRCLEVQGMLDPYAAGQLPEEAARRVADHLEQCPKCSREAKWRLWSKSAVKSAIQSIEVPDDLEGRVRQHLHDDASPQRSFGWRLPAALVVASALGLLLASVFLNRADQPWEVPEAERAARVESICQRVGQPAAVGLADHLQCAFYREYPDDPPPLEEVEQTLGPEYAPLLALVRAHLPDGFLVWMGHECTVGDRDYVHLAIRRGEELLSVIVTRRREGESFAAGSSVPLALDSDISLHLSGADGFRVAGFETDEYLAFVASNLPEDRNAAFARAVAAPVVTYLNNRQRG